MSIAKVRWGKGIALDIRNKWPLVYNQYLQNGIGEHLLGTIQYVRITDDLKICNLYGQVYYGMHKPYRGNCHLDYDAIQQGFDNILCTARWNDYSVHVPWMIGCKNAGGSWDRVLAILQEESDKYPSVDVNIWKLA